jgi:hypothetical protein
MTTIAEKMTAEEAYKIALNDPIRRITDKKIIEEAILESSGLEYVNRYANNVINGRWAEGERAIINSKEKNKSQLIFNYAAYVVKDRWIEAEAALVAGIGLCNEAEYYLVSYHTELVCGHTRMAKDRSGYKYEKNEGAEKRDRWIEYEHILYELSLTNNSDCPVSSWTELNNTQEKNKKHWKPAYDAKKCYDHAKDVVKGRWVEGEEIISKHEYWWQEYKNFISEVRWDLAPAVDFKNTELEDLKKARAELDAKIKLLETQV